MKTSYYYVLSDFVKSDGTQSLVCRVLKNRKKRDYDLGIAIKKEQWIEGEPIGMVVNNPSAKRYNIKLGEKWDFIVKTIDDLERINSEITVEQIIEKLRKPGGNKDVESVANELIERYNKAKQEGTADNYKYAVNGLLSFVGRKTLYFSDVTPKVLLDYEAHLKGKGLSPATIQGHLAKLRALFKTAERQGDIPKGSSPFEQFSVKKAGHSQKTKLTKEQLLLFLETDLETMSPIWQARAAFYIQYNLMGARIMDVLKLKVGDNTLTYTNGDIRLFYAMGKNKKIRSALFDADNQYKSWLELLMAGKKKGDYLLPFYAWQKPELRELEKRKNARRSVNRYLDIIAKMAGIEDKVTSHISRHTFASITYGTKKDLRKLQNMLAHSSAATTEGYLHALMDGEFDADMKDVKV